MAVDNASVVDGLGIDEENTALRLLDRPSAWKESADTINEYDHLLMLQEKINAYISFIETEQYRSNYPDIDFRMAIMDIRFKYDITDNCERFLQAVQEQVGRYGTRIKA